VTEIEDFLRRAGAYDSDGQPRLDRVQGSKGQWFLIVVDKDGLPITFWGQADPRLDDENSFRDEAGNVLKAVVILHEGSLVVTSVDASLRPTIEISAFVTKDGRTTSANPGGWPLTTEELDRIDRAEAPEIPGNLAEWQRRSLVGVARDPLGRLLTTRLRAADGQWADVVMMDNGEPQRFEVDFGDVQSGKPSGEVRAVTTARSARGWILVELNEQGLPSFGTPSLNARMQQP
jgi:hypothetical protein